VRDCSGALAMAQSHDEGPARAIGLVMPAHRDADHHFPRNLTGSSIVENFPVCCAAQRDAMRLRRLLTVLLALSAVLACASGHGTDTHAPVRVDAPVDENVAGPGLAAAIDGLGSDDSKERSGAAVALWRMGEGALPALPKLAGVIREDPDPAVRWLAVMAVGPLAETHPEAVEALATAISDAESEVRKHAIYVLGSLGPKARLAVPRLRVAVSDPEAIVRVAAHSALARITGDPASIAAMVEALDDASVDVQADAATALSLHGPAARAATHRLRAIMNDPKSTPRLRGAAHAALESIGDAQ